MRSEYSGSRTPQKEYRLWIPTFGVNGSTIEGTYPSEEVAKVRCKQVNDLLYAMNLPATASVEMIR